MSTTAVNWRRKEEMDLRNSFYNIILRHSIALCAAVPVNDDQPHQAGIMVGATEL
jgi:hypothetical protein